MDGPIHDNLISIKQKRLLLVFYLFRPISYLVIGLLLPFMNSMVWGAPCDSSSFGSNIAWCALVILVFVPIAANTVHGIFSPKIVFAYNDYGFYIKNLKVFVRWDDVLFAKIFFTWSRKRGPRKTDLILLKLRDETTFVNSLTRFGKFWYLVNKKFCGYGISLSLGATGVSPEHVMSIFREKCRNLQSG